MNLIPSTKDGVPTQLAERSEKMAGEILDNNKLSAIIRIAIKDLKEVMKNPKMRPTGSVWISNDSDGDCQFCLAGAVLIHRLDAHKVFGVVCMVDMPTKTKRLMDVLDHVRSHRLVMAQERLRPCTDESLEALDSVEDSVEYVTMHDLPLFLARMEYFIAELERLGL